MLKSAATAMVLVLAAAAIAGDEKKPDEPKKDGKAAMPKDKAPADTRTKAEVAADATAQFTRADGNGDGYLKGDEVAKGWLERFDADADARISRSEFMEISTRPPKLRRLHPMRDAVARVRQDLAMFDKNKDGAIQKDEYPGDQVKFRSFDRNKDDALSQAETMAMAEDEIADIRKKMKNPSRYEFLTLFDVDGNRDITMDEYDGPIADFRKFDKDGDGTASYEEIYPERMMENMKDAYEGPKPEDLSMIETMDKDKDGKVERSEFKGTDAAWKRLDRNEDGVITIADAR